MELEKQDCPVCRRCGRKLKTPEARERGMGKTCWAKYYTEKKNLPLFEVKK